jgi:hypothetical protein
MSGQLPSMAARDELQRELAFAGPAFTGDEDADRIDLHQHAVQRDLPRQRARKVILQIRQKLVTALRADPERRLRFLGGLAKVCRHRLVLRYQQRGRPVRDDFFDGLPALPRIEPVEINELFGADDLHLVRIDDVEIADQRRPPRLRAAGLEHSVFAAHARDPAQRQALADGVEKLAG